MNNFQMIKINHDKYNLLFVMKTYEAPFLYLNEMADTLREQQFSGDVLIDELMHSGNNNDRFIEVYFDGKNFDKKTFSFVDIDRRNEIRKYSCELLRKEPDIVDFSMLNKAQKNLICKGIYI